MRARVVVVAGPSGSGKSRLCERLAADLALPVVHLDDFYRSGDDPELPRVALPGGKPIVDWDDPRSWHRQQALTALRTLCGAGAVDVPVYDIASDSRVGHRLVELGDAAYVLAEGIFADQVVPGCIEGGMLADAVCVHNPRGVTFWRRLTRDLREGRKPPWVLIRRGVALLRADPAVVARAVSMGCEVVSSSEAYERVRRCVLR
jgi:uridine kinase